MKSVYALKCVKFKEQNNSEIVTISCYQDQFKNVMVDMRLLRSTLLEIIDGHRKAIVKYQTPRFLDFQYFYRDGSMKSSLHLVWTIQHDKLTVVAFSSETDGSNLVHTSKTTWCWNNAAEDASIPFELIDYILVGVHRLG